MLFGVFDSLQMRPCVKHEKEVCVDKGNDGGRVEGKEKRVEEKEVEKREKGKVVLGKVLLVFV